MQKFSRFYNFQFFCNLIIQEYQEYLLKLKIKLFILQQFSDFYNLI